MAYAPAHITPIIGSFTEKEHGKYFEISKAPMDVISPPAHGGKNRLFPHAIWMSDGSFRVALVMKTVAHVIVDETRNRWVVEKWDIKLQYMSTEK